MNFTVKKVQFTDIPAQVTVFGYDIGITKREGCKEVKNMRHVYMRGIIGVILLAAAMVGGGPLCLILGSMSVCSAYIMWKKEQEGKGDK